jgi:putative CocE/NonD family hydrolase
VRVFWTILLASLAALAAAQGWRDRYVAREMHVPMRDGVKLYTLVYIPKGKAGPFPILLERTPYGAGSPDHGPARTTPGIEKAGYILAFQDVRGSGNSEGTFVDVRPILARGEQGTDESTDAYDTIDHLVREVKESNGRVGLWGISYPGFYAGAGAVRGHPALKAVSPQAPVNDWFLGDDVHHRGAFFLQENFDFCINFNVPRGERPPVVRREGSAYDFFLSLGALRNIEERILKGRIPYWDELMRNDTYNEYWRSRALWRSFRDVSAAVLVVGGWFDKENLWGALNLFKAGLAQNDKTPHYLVMGPWSHGQFAGRGGESLGSLVFGSPTAAWYQDNVELPFFERWLRGRPAGPDIAKVTVFETGVNRWRTYDQWPPKDLQPTSVFLGRDRAITWTRPSEAEVASYVYNPAQPTPYLADYRTSRSAPSDWLARDQRFLDERNDQVTFRSGRLDESLRVAGPIVADLWITTTGTCVDLVVQVIDEYPPDSTDKNPKGGSLAGHQMMVRGEVMRAKFRDSWIVPKPITPGEPTRVRFELNDVMHTFRKGHRLVVRIMSSWFPIVDRNSNTFVSRTDARDDDFRPATIQLMVGGEKASRIELGMLPMED